MKHRDIDNLQGVLSDSIIAAAISELRRYTPVSEEE